MFIKNVSIAAVLLSCIGASSIASQAQTQPVLPVALAGTPVAGPGQLLVPERTQVKVELIEDLKSGANKEGEDVDYRVREDVYNSDHVLLIPAGTPAQGSVTKSSRRGVFGKAGKLQFTCEYINLMGKVHIPLRVTELGSSGANNGGAAVATSLFFLSPLGFLINGKDVTVNKGHQFTLYVDAATVIPNPTPPPAVIAPPVAAPAPVATTPGRSLFTLKSGLQLAGVLLSFDGANYEVQTDIGTQTIKATDVKSVYALAAPSK